jgi:hypothetical protein
VWTRGPATPACLASTAPPRRSNACLHLWDPHPSAPEGRLPPVGCVPRHLPLPHPMLRLPCSQGPELIVNLMACPALWPSLLQLHPRCSHVVTAKPSLCHIPYFGPVFPSLLSPSVHYVYHTSVGSAYPIQCTDPIWSDVWIQSDVRIRSGLVRSDL